LRSHKVADFALASVFIQPQTLAIVSTSPFLSLLLLSTSSVRAIVSPLAHCMHTNLRMIPTISAASAPDRPSGVAVPPVSPFLGYQPSTQNRAEPLSIPKSGPLNLSEAGVAGSEAIKLLPHGLSGAGILEGSVGL